MSDVRARFGLGTWWLLAVVLLVGVTVALGGPVGGRPGAHPAPPPGSTAGPGVTGPPPSTDVAPLPHVPRQFTVLAAGDIPVERIERGGEVTYHGPGQLMVYPVVRLRSVVGFLERVAGAIAETCAALGAPGAAWQRDPAGIWLGGQKLAACGIHIARSVSVHGFALNVDTPPEAWRAIRPCGLDVPQISLVRARGAPITVAEVAQELGPRVAQVV